jgi:hypothetical protein
MKSRVYKYNLPLIDQTLDGTNEAIELTKKHFNIVEKFAEAVENNAQGMLVTGSTAWGAYSAVTSSSDVDLLITVKDIETLKKIIKKYIQEGLILSSEQKRFEEFEKLAKRYSVCQFSIITQHKGIPVSLDFLTADSLEVICNIDPINLIELKIGSASINLRTIKEFRSNPPKTSGYYLDNLRKEERIIYHPKFEIIKNDKEEILGYFSDTLIDGQTVGQDSPTYFLGVISFFLAISPLVLFDKDKKLQQSISKIQENIGRMLNNELPEYITRQERMPSSVLEKIKKFLVKSSDRDGSI